MGPDAFKYVDHITMTCKKESVNVWREWWAPPWSSYSDIFLVYILSVTSPAMKMGILGPLTLFPSTPQGEQVSWSVKKPSD